MSTSEHLAPPPGLADVPYLVVNPASGAGSTGRRWPALEREARRVLGRIEVGRTDRPGHATALARAAIEAGHRTIVAVGGDGTLNEVVNGFFREDGTPVARDAAVAILPQGTGGDFKRTAGVPARWEGALRHLAGARVRPIDVGRVRYRRHDGGEGVRHFVNVGSLGVPGAVDEAVHNGPKWLGGHLAFLLSTVRVLVGWRDRRVRMSVDGGPAEEVPVTSLAMANGRFFGGGMQVAPAAVLDDGTFHCTLWHAYTVWDFVVKSKGVYNGEHVTWPKTRTFTARRVHVESDERVLLDLDGEQPGLLPATFEVVPGAIGLRG